MARLAQPVGRRLAHNTPAHRGSGEQGPEKTPVGELNGERGYEKAWETEAAALAARPHFKRWVEDGLRHAHQRAGQAAQAATRSDAVALARARIPIRFSGRNRLHNCSNTASTQCALSLQVDRSGTVAVMISLAQEITEVLIQRWKERSAQLTSK